MQTLKRLLWLQLPFNILLGLTACSGVSGDFSLAASPATLAVTAGGTGQFSFSATPQNGFSAPVTVAVTGLPAGVTANPSTLTLSSAAAQTITMTAASSAAAAMATLTLTGTSGILTHVATVALSVAAAPPPPPPPPPPPAPADFSLTVSPTSQMVTVGNSGSQVTLLATAINSLTGTVAVMVNGLPAGVTTSPATLNLTPGSSQGISLIAAASALPGAATVTFTGTSGSLTHTATLAVTLKPATTTTPTGSDVTTYHYDNARDGLYAAETNLTVANVNSTGFGLMGVYPVDGKVDAQPLYVGGLKLQTGTQVHTVNVVYVATEHDSVYALDVKTGAQEWKTSILGIGETPSDPRNCNQVTPEIGITATPVIDRSFGTNGAIFAVGMSKDASGGYHHRLHALDLTTGVELPGSPTEIAATYPGNGIASQNGKDVFDPAQYEERASLLLLNGTIYTAWSSHCDIAPYSGWVMGYSESKLQQSTVLNLVPNGSDGSVWMSGYGPSADARGNIYLLDANGTLDSGFTASGFPNQNDYGNALLKLSTTGGLAVSDFFEPYNTVAESAADEDLGSGGAMVLPDITDTTGTAHHLVVGAGKDGNLYVGDRDNLGKLNQKAPNNSNLYQEIPNAFPNQVFSGPAYFNNAVYYAGVDDVLRAFTFSNAMLGMTATSQSMTSFAYPGSTPSVSANGTKDGIVWALESAANASGVLHAYDATNLSHELYNSNQAPNKRDAFGLGNKFITPMIANGSVFVGTTNGVAVFGLLKP